MCRPLSFARAVGGFRGFPCCQHTGCCAIPTSVIFRDNSVHAPPLLLLLLLLLLLALPGAPVSRAFHRCSWRSCL